MTHHETLTFKYPRSTISAPPSGAVELDLETLRAITSVVEAVRSYHPREAKHRSNHVLLYPEHFEIVVEYGDPQNPWQQDLPQQGMLSENFQFPSIAKDIAGRIRQLQDRDTEPNIRNEFTPVDDILTKLSRRGILFVDTHDAENNEMSNPGSTCIPSPPNTRRRQCVFVGVSTQAGGRSCVVDHRDFLLDIADDLDVGESIRAEGEFERVKQVWVYRPVGDVKVTTSTCGHPRQLDLGDEPPSPDD